MKSVSTEKITLRNAFEIADSVLKQGVESISGLISDSSYINLDFADVRAIMKDAGRAHMGIGRASGENRAQEAAKMAISSPLLETSIDEAMGVIIFFVVPADVGLDEVDEAATLITSTANEEANIIWGARFDPNMTDEFKVTVVATGFENAKKNKKDDDFSRAAKADLIGDKNGNWFDDEDFDVINWSSKTTHLNDDESEKYLESIKAVLRGNSGK